jgi:serine/threonine protein kinase
VNISQISFLGKKVPSIDDYEIGETLGRGNYGLVKAVTHKKTGMELALKIYEK